VENHGFVLGPLSIKPVNQQDTIILPETLTALVDFTRRIGIDLCGASLTLDAGFDSKDNKDAIKAHKMKPVISHSAPLGGRATYFPRSMFLTHSTPQPWYGVIV
jgi:hypothetical protein